MTRRLAACAAWVLLLHLNLIATNVGCVGHRDVRHDHVAGVTGPSATPHHPGAIVAHGSDARSGSSAPCEVPTRGDCCPAFGACSMSLGVPARVPRLTPARATPSVTEHARMVPASTSPAPATPPPKA